MELRDPDVSLRAAFQRMAEEFRAAGEARHREVCSMDEAAFAAYVTRLSAASRGEGLERGRVLEHSYWALDNSELVGVSRLRPTLDAFHERLTGHLGFELIPARWTLPTGLRLVEQTLEKARVLGKTGLLVCCDPENERRRQVFELAGAVLLDEVSGLLQEGDAYRKVRYRIAL